MAAPDPTAASRPDQQGGDATSDWDITAGVSFTALTVAAGRAIETERPDALISDPYAEAFVSASGRPLPLGWPPRTGALAAATGLDEALLHRLWTGLADYMAVRTCFFDQALLHACQEYGIRQVVVPAAGLDTRALRLAWPAGTVVYEIDQPKVLAFKEHALSGQGVPTGGTRELVGCDLREDWPRALRHSGFDPDQPTAWLAEGLLMYLPDEAKETLAQRVQALSAPGSRWAIETVTDTAVLTRILGENAPTDRGTAELSGDLSGVIPSEQHWQPQTWLTQRGWNVTSASALTVAARYGRRIDETAPLPGQHSASTLLTATLEYPQQPASDPEAAPFN